MIPFDWRNFARRAPLFYATRLGSKRSSVIIEELKGQMSGARNPVLMLSGVAALSRASVKILPNFCLVRVRSVMWL